MANTKSAEKRAREAIERRARNVAHRSKVRSAVRRVVEAIRAGNKAEAQAALKAAAPVIDAMARKGIIHRNKAARHKSRLASQIKSL
jgi:small subunit ribosomal protein S20